MGFVVAPKLIYRHIFPHSNLRASVTMLAEVRYGGSPNGLMLLLCKHGV